MTDTVTDADVETHDDDHAHPSDWAYVKVALVLAVLTALEVAFESTVDNHSFLIWSLMIMMVVKFWIVAAYFMHLKYDSKMFTQLFVAGIVLACGVYIAMLAAFQFWA